MSIPRLIKEPAILMSYRGLLNFREFSAAIRRLKAEGDITVSEARVTETPRGVSIQKKSAAPGTTPFDCVAFRGGSGIETRITPGFLFAGCTFTVPEISGISILSASAPTITDLPKNIYLKINWRPVIALDYRYSSYPPEDDPIARAWAQFPSGLELISSEIVWTGEDSPSDAGWTPSGDDHLYAVIRKTETVDPSTMSAVLISDGEHYERIATRNPDWKEGDDLADFYLTRPAASDGGYGHRNVKWVESQSTTSVSTGPPVVDDLGYGLDVIGVSLL